MEIILEFILEYLWESILGLVCAIAGIRKWFFPRKKSKSILQKTFQFGFWNKSENNVTDKDTKED